MALELQSSAQIIPFPVDRSRRSEVRMTNESEACNNSQPHVVPHDFPVMDFGAGWYHDQAMTDANLSRN